MAPDRHNFSHSGPTHLTTVDWTNVHHRRSVVASLVKGVRVVERDRRKKSEGSQALASPWWEFFNFQMHEQLKDDDDSSIYGAIYKFEPPASHIKPSKDGCPCYVIAFRGNLLKGETLKEDLELDLQIILNKLDLKPRFKKAMQAVRSKVVDSSNVWLAGHSLGSAIALLAGRTMAEEGIFLETFLFNLPYPSVPIEKITEKITEDKTVNHVIRGTGNLIRAGVALALKKNNHNNQSGDPFLDLSAWVPRLFVHKDDIVSSGYVGYFKHKKKMEEFGAGGIERLATQVSLRSLILEGKLSEPMHRIQSANLTVNLTNADSIAFNGIKQAIKQAHGIHQWWEPDQNLESTLYKRE